MTLDKYAWTYRREANLSDFLTMDDLTRILAETIRSATFFTELNDLYLWDVSQRQLKPEQSLVHLFLWSPDFSNILANSALL